MRQWMGMRLQCCWERRVRWAINVQRWMHAAWLCASCWLLRCLSHGVKAKHERWQCRRQRRAMMGKGCWMPCPVSLRCHCPPRH